MSLYDELKAAGVAIDHHESDLYCESTDTSRRIIMEHREKNGGYPRSVSGFISRTDNRSWLDIPFAYDPWWQSRGMR